jgi:hypothetical protein
LILDTACCIITVGTGTNLPADWLHTAFQAEYSLNREYLICRIISHPAK